MAEESHLVEAFEKYIKGTAAQSLVVEAIIRIGTLTEAVSEALSSSSAKVHTTTKAIKHLYDKKPAEEFDCLLRYLPDIIRAPDHIYKNKPEKRGDICFAKTINGNYYFCTLEECPIISPDLTVELAHCVVTCFRLREEKRENYIKNYKCIWSWKGDIPSS